MIDHRLIRPFPQPGPLIELAYRDLLTATLGTEAQVRA
jgi:hypothetical protein